MITIHENADLLGLLYQGPFEQPLWGSFLDRLRAELKAGLASIAYLPAGRTPGDPVALRSGERAAPELERLFDAPLRPGGPPVFGLRAGRVYDLIDLLEPGNPDHDALRAGTLEPAGLQHIRSIRVTEKGGGAGWLTVARADPDFSAADSALLLRLAPHFERALHTHFALERERSRASVAAGMMERLNFGWIGLDAAGCMIEASDGAQRLLRLGDQLRTRRQRLIAVDPAVDRQITTALRELASEPAPRPRAIHVSRDPWLDILLAPVLDPAEAPAPGVATIVYVQGDNRSAADRHEQLADLFGLLPSEARLALALGRGMTIAEAADALGLSVETARNYSKKIYAKMGARGQSDLVRHVLTSVLAFA